MSRAIREHLRDFLAIIALVLAGVVTTFIILANQSTALPSWVPILGEERFELKAKFSSAQAVNRCSSSGVSPALRRSSGVRSARRNASGRARPRDFVISS